MTILVTGTDIGVGKTWVACALARSLRESGKQVVAIKPVETGCSAQPSKSEDGVRLARATGQSQPAHAIIRLPDPIAPVLSSERAGAEIDFDALVLKIERYAESAEYAIIEGAGGLLAPVTWEWNMADMARVLGARALVVAADRLGTINHTLLTLSALELAGIACVGVVLTTPEKKDQSTGQNGAAIARLSGIDRVVSLPRTGDDAAAAASVLPVIEWLGRVPAPA
ncbi:MAG TPA: dethiobiotin synthase [Gemmatimonadales bacterium]|nr:dethiobiotin synthase [Gemmatimonadales bacterium]